MGLFQLRQPLLAAGVMTRDDLQIWIAQHQLMHLHDWQFKCIGVGIDQPA